MIKKIKLKNLHRIHGIRLGNYSSSVQRVLTGICTQYFKNSEQVYPAQPVELGKHYLEKEFLSCVLKDEVVSQTDGSSGGGKGIEEER